MKRTFSGLVAVAIVAGVLPTTVFAYTMEQECRDRLGIEDYSERNKTLLYKLNRCINNKRAEAANAARLIRYNKRRESMSERSRRRIKALVERRNTGTRRDLIHQAQARQRFRQGYVRSSRYNLFKQLRKQRRDRIRTDSSYRQKLNESVKNQDKDLKAALEECHGLLFRLKASCVRNELIKSRPTRSTRYRSSK